MRPRAPGPRPLARFGALVLALRAAAGSSSAGSSASAGSAAAPAPLPQPARGEERDPFRPPERAGPETRPPGLPGLRIVEASVRGILLRPGAPGDSGAPDSPARSDSVILEAPDGRGFVASPGAKLLDGVLLRVEEDGAVFLTNRRPPSEFFRPLSTGPPPDRQPNPPPNPP